MNQLNGQSVILVLSIREGHGFDFLQKPLYIEASLKKSKIESDPIPADPNPHICTELVWETEKKEVRKLRSSHVPCRIECYTLDESNNKQKLGFVLLNLRTAQPVQSHQVPTIEYKWYKLMSVPPEYKVCRPELAITLTIQDKSDQNDLSLRPQESIRPDGTIKTRIIPVSYLNSGYIQIGEESIHNQRFVFSILVKEANNLDLLLNKSYVFNSQGRKFHISLAVLGLTVNTKSFSRNLHESLKLNDRVLFKVISTVNILKLFIREYQKIPLSLHQDTEVIATSEIDLQCFFDKDTLHPGEKWILQQNYEFKRTDGEVLPVTDRKPYVSIEIVIELDSVKKVEVNDEASRESLNISNTIKSPFSTDTVNASGDQGRKEYSETKNSPRFPNIQQDVSIQTSPKTVKIIRSSSTLLKNSKQLTVSKGQNLLANYRYYCLHITFLSLTWRKTLNLKGFQFKFQHPKAHNVLNIHCDLERVSENDIIQLEDVYCKMFFLSTPENIKNLLMSYPPTICLETLNNVKIADDFIIFTKLLSEEEDSSCIYFVILNKEGNRDDLLCDLQIEMELKEISSDFNLNDDKDEHNIYPVVIDEWFATQTVQNLEKWKKNQERIFTDRLVVEKNQKMELLEAEWNLKKIELETKLQQGIEKCRILSEDLNKNVKKLKSRYQFVDKKILCNVSSHEKIELKVTEMMEKEMNKAIRKVEAEKQCIMDKYNQVQKEKKVLVDLLSEKESQLEDIRRHALTKEQTTSIIHELRQLEEKFEVAVAEKNFFKEQWGHALKEVHFLKAEDQRLIKENIKRNKEELIKLTIPEIIDEEEEEEEVDEDEVLSEDESDEIEEETDVSDEDEDTPRPPKFDEF